MSSFTRALRDRLDIAAVARAGRRDATVALMEERARRDSHFEPAAEEIHRTIIRPLTEELARAFDNCAVEHHRTPTGFTSRCRLAPTVRYPATAELVIGIGQIAEAPGAVLSYHLGIIPELMSFTKTDSCGLDLDRLDREALRARLAGWLLRFTDTYLRLESEPNYQDWHTHVDPVCGMRITGAAAQVIEYERRKIYVCSDYCRTRFEADPGLFLNGVAPLA
jgi:YHS domain-containing protein